MGMGQETVVANGGEARDTWQPMGWDTGVIAGLWAKALENTGTQHGWAEAAVVSHSRISARLSLGTILITHQFIVLMGKNELIQFFFGLPTFCFSMDRADGNLVSQLFSVPIWSEYIWKEIIWIHLLFKNESENRHGVEGGGFYLFLPACPISIVSQEKQRNKLLQH